MQGGQADQGKGPPLDQPPFIDPQQQPTLALCFQHKSHSPKSYIQTHAGPRGPSSPHSVICHRKSMRPQPLQRAKLGGQEVQGLRRPSDR